MTTYSLKTQFQNLLRPFAYRLNDWGITPNQTTVITCLLSFTYAALVVYVQLPILFYLFPVFFVVRMALNAIDGIMAKEKNKITKLGAILNEIGDVLSDAVLAAVFFFVSGVNVNYLWLFIYLSLFVECAGLWAYLLKHERFYNGPLGKSDRGIILTLMAFNAGWMLHSPGTAKLFINEILLVSLPLLVLTVFNRVRHGL